MLCHQQQRQCVAGGQEQQGTQQESDLPASPPINNMHGKWATASPHVMSVPTSPHQLPAPSGTHTDCCEGVVRRSSAPTTTNPRHTSWPRPPANSQLRAALTPRLAHTHAHTHSSKHLLACASGPYILPASDPVDGQAARGGCFRGGTIWRRPDEAPRLVALARPCACLGCPCVPRMMVAARRQRGAAAEPLARGVGLPLLLPALLGLLFRHCDSQPLQWDSQPWLAADGGPEPRSYAGLAGT